MKRLDTVWFSVVITVMLTYIQTDASAQVMTEAGRLALERENQKIEQFLDHRGHSGRGRHLDSLVSVAAFSSGRQLAPDRLKLTANQLALLGYTRESIGALRSDGIDVIDLAIRLPNELTLVNKAVLSEACIIAEVVSTINTLQPEDGFRSSVALRVVDELSGNVSGDEIILRRLSGPDTDGGISVSSDFEGQVGERYLMFVSNHLYQYHVMFPEPYAAPVRDAHPRKLGRYYLEQFRAVRLEDEAAADSVGLVDRIRSAGALLDMHLKR